MTSPPLAAIALLSAAALGYEILLMRLFSIILWHHFAYMMISVALLGYGAAGTFVALAQGSAYHPRQVGRRVNPGKARDDDDHYDQGGDREDVVKRKRFRFFEQRTHLKAG